MDDFDWLEPLCADDYVPQDLAETPLGQIHTGQQVQLTPDALAAREDVPPGPLQVTAVVAGFKGRPPFRKRLWVAVRLESGSWVGRASPLELQPA